jgi:hypothetical protein
LFLPFEFRGILPRRTRGIAYHASSWSRTTRCSRGSTLLRTNPFSVPRDIIRTNSEYTAPAMGARGGIRFPPGDYAICLPPAKLPP